MTAYAEHDAPEAPRSWHKAQRLTALLAELQARPQSTAELARSFGVGQRSVQRDLEALRAMGHFVQEDTPGLYFIPRNGTLLRPAEVLAAYTALRLAHHHSPALGGHDRRALHTLSLALPERVRHTLNASIRSGGQGVFTDRQMELVAAAWLDGQVLRFDHRERNGILRTGLELGVYFVEISRTNLAPFVIGLNRAAGTVGTYKLARMSNLHLLADRYDVDPHFDPQAYLSDAWGVIGGEDSVTVTVRFDPEAAYRVLEGGFPQSTLIRGDGFVDLEFRAGVDDAGLPRELMPFLLSWGARAEVLSPPEVRCAWLAELRDALARFDRTPQVRG
ncbi:WYL domain-containing protein (plasmid) [Deinococcus taeanensis]|uniref:helix-turn-helix transcriptional regulator n=1 Tax=Deinococcus taeanensis TaxID=2737050 RepID=UPI001CDD7BC0|nr:WYL domain-containing protein [Deinococcus taeanensis]UBV44083.1 WYL domain-containing protein [Deinococcus taeanensis]